MYTLWIANGSSALAAHILLEEIGAAYQTKTLSIPEREHLAPDYLNINPRGRVPALVTPQGVLTENPAILAYLAQAHPDSGLAPADPFAFARAQSLNLYLASTVHPAFAHKLRGARYADDPAAIEAMKAKVSSNIAECADMVEHHLISTPWALGDHFSFCDPYLFLMHRWMAATAVDIDGYPKLAAHAAAMKERRSVQTVLALHGI